METEEWHSITAVIVNTRTITGQQMKCRILLSAATEWKIFPSLS
jgi:hypothetical protein